MDMPPVASTQGRRATAVVDRNLDELYACLDDALSSSRQRRSPYAEERLRDAIAGKTVFLRSLLAAEAECHGGARPEHLAEAEARFAVLESAFDQWARRRAVVAAPEPVEEEGEEEKAACSGSSCSCTDSCQLEATEGDAKREDVVEARDKEGPPDAIAGDDDAEVETAETRREQAADTVAKKREDTGTRQEEEVTLDAVAKERDTDREAAAGTGRRAVQRRRRWRLSACGAAGVVVVVAVGLALELAAVARHNVNVYVVPT